MARRGCRSQLSAFDLTRVSEDSVNPKVLHAVSLLRVAGGLVLILGGLNLASQFLARGLERSRSLGLHTVLGAPRLVLICGRPRGGAHRRHPGRPWCRRLDPRGAHAAWDRGAQHPHEPVWNDIRSGRLASRLGAGRGRGRRLRGRGHDREPCASTPNDAHRSAVLPPQWRRCRHGGLAPSRADTPGRAPRRPRDGSRPRAHGSRPAARQEPGRPRPLRSRLPTPRRRRRGAPSPDDRPRGSHRRLRRAGGSSARADTGRRSRELGELPAHRVRLLHERGERHRHSGARSGRLRARGGG